MEPALRRLTLHVSGTPSPNSTVVAPSPLRPPTESPTATGYPSVDVSDLALAADIGTDASVHNLANYGSTVLRSKIIVRDTFGRVERTFETQKAVFAIAVSGDNVACSKGEVNTDISSAYHMHLMLSNADEASQPTQVAQHFYDIEMDRNWLIWESKRDGTDSATTGESAIPAQSCLTSRESWPAVQTPQWVWPLADTPAAVDGAVAWDEARPSRSSARASAPVAAQVACGMHPLALHRQSRTGIHADPSRTRRPRRAAPP